MQVRSTRLGVDSRHETRGTILVASASAAFGAVLGELVMTAGYTAVFPGVNEVPWRTIARTEPRALIHDGDAPVASAKWLLAEAVGRGIPILLSSANGTQQVTEAVTGFRRIAPLML